MIRHARLAPGPVSAGGVMAPSGACAIALFVIVGDDAAELDAWLGRAGFGAMTVGRARLVDALGIDEAVLARPSARVLHLMPHGGPACVRGIAEALEATGAPGMPPGAIAPELLCPAAGTLRQALAMALLGLAASPMAVDVLARQGAMDEPSTGSAMEEEALLPLRRLLVPPTVAIVGSANIGKSTLLNALARRRAAIVADEPGTTRDHVGVSLVLDGLAVRWLDTPGLRALDPARSQGEAVEAAARAIADRAVAGADLVILAADHDGAFPDWPPAGAATEIPTLRVRLRCDRTRNAGDVDAAEPVVRIAVPPDSASATGLRELAWGVRRAFVPDAWLARALHEPLGLDEAAGAMGFARGLAPR